MVTETGIVAVGMSCERYLGKICRTVQMLGLRDIMVCEWLLGSREKFKGDFQAFYLEPSGYCTTSTGSFGE